MTILVFDGDWGCVGTFPTLDAATGWMMRQGFGVFFATDAAVDMSHTLVIYEQYQRDDEPRIRRFPPKRKRG